MGNAQIHLGIEEPGPKSRRHLAFETEQGRVVRERLEAADIPIEEAITLEGVERFYCHDPFGNRLEIWSPLSP